MRIFKILIVILILFIIEYFGYWQFSLYREMRESNKNISCGGDFSYFVKCPKGTFCKSGKQGPFAGGECSTYLKPLFDLYLK